MILKAPWLDSAWKSPGELLPAYRKIEDQRYAEGTVGAGWFILSLIVRYYFRHRRRDYTVSIGRITIL
jgi:hypothetical protein